MPERQTGNLGGKEETRRTGSGPSGRARPWGKGGALESPRCGEAVVTDSDPCERVAVWIQKPEGAGESAAGRQRTAENAGFPAERLPESG